MTYQELAAYLRSEYSSAYGGTEWRDDILLVEDYMKVRPDAMDWDIDISNFNELQGLTEEGDPLPVAGYGKQVGFVGTNLALLFPQMVQAEQAGELIQGDRGETTTAEDISILAGGPTPWEPAPEDREEGWGEWYRRSMANIAGVAKGALGAPIDKVMALRRLMLQQTGRISPEIAEKALRGAEDYRRWKNEWTNEWIDSDPELQGLLLWNKEHPVGFKELVEGNAGDVVMRGLIQAAPSLGAFMAANYIAGPEAAMGVAFALGKAASYDETMSVLVDEMGIPPEEAIGYANDMSTIVGAGEMVLESIGGFGIASALGRGKVAKELWGTAGRRWLINKIANPAIRKKLQSETAYTLVDVAKSGGKEYLTEAFQNMNSFLGVEAAKQGYGDGAPENALADITKQYGDFLSSRERQKEVWKESEAGAAGFVGFIAGASVSAAGLAPSAWDDYQYWKKQKAKRERDEFFRPVREAEAKRRFDEEVEEAEFEEAGVPTPVERQLALSRRHIDFIEDDALMLNLVTRGLEAIPEDQKERAIHLRKVYGLSNNRKALEKINDILNRRADVVEKAGLTPAGIKEGIIAQFPSDNKDLNKIISSVNERVDKYEAGEIVPTGEPVSKPKEGLPLDVLDRLEGVDVTEEPPVITDVVPDLFEQRDIEPYVEEEVTDPDDIILPEEDVVIDVTEPTEFEEPSEEVLKFAAEGDQYKGDNIDQKPTVPAEEQLTPVEEEVVEEAPAEVEKTEVKIVEGTPNTKRAARKGEGIYVMRPNKGDKIPLVDEVNNFGNPWSVGGYQGTIKVKDIPTAVANYRAWIRGESHQDIEPERRQWILDQVDKGALDNQTLLYFKAGYRSHADELQNFVNERKEAPAEVTKDLEWAEAKVAHIEELKAEGKRIPYSEAEIKEAYTELARLEEAPAEGIKPLKDPMLEADANIELNKLIKDHGVIIKPHKDKNRIGMIVVPKDARGKGIGRQVFEAIKKRSIGMGLDYIKIEAATGDFKLPDGEIAPSPIGFWEKMGFVKTGERRRDKRVLDPGWVEVMEYSIPAGEVKPVDPSDIDEGIEVTGIDFKKLQKRPPGMPNQSEIDEKLQRIALGDKIEDNYEAFLAIESRLGRLHPYVNVQKLNQVFTQHGEEVAGKAIGTGIQVSMTQGDIGTIAHEYAEVYVDLLEGDKFINDALNRLKQKDRKQAKHLLASHIDQYYTGKMKDKGLLSRMKLFLKRFLTTLKSFFKTLEDQELYDLIANKFFAGVGARRAQRRATAEEAGPKEEALQPLNTKLGESRLAMFFDEMWFRVKAAGRRESRTVDFKSVLPDIREFIQAVQGSIPQVYQNALKLWAQDRFPIEGKAYYEHTRRSNYHYTPGEDDIAFLDYGYIQRMIEDDQFADINEGMGKVNMGELDIDLSGADAKLESVVLRTLGVTLTTKENNALFHKTRDAESFTEFLEYFKNNIKPILRGGDHTQLLRYYLARRSTVAVNREDRAGNERDNLIINLYKKNPSVEYAGPLDIVRNDKKNKKWDKINLLEHITGQRLIWATGSNTFDQRNGTWHQSYSFLTAENLVMLEPLFNKLKIVPVVTRGEKANLAFVEWNEDHKVKAANARKYWQKQFGEGKVTEKQMLNFLGAKREPADITYEFLAGEIARFEAYENMLPGAIKKGDGAKILKRAKIFTVGVSISDEIPDQSLEIFDPTNVSFVSSNGHVQPAMVQIPGHEGLRYIFDGGTPTSHDTFNDFRVFMGLQQGAKHFKTVVYNNDATDLIAMKHQHFEMEPGLEAWENHGKSNAKLLWKVDENRNIINAEGEQVGFMNTEDESKIASSNKMTIPGNAIGAIKHGNTHTTGKHPLQVYNYRREDSIKEAFKEHYLPQIDSRIKNEISGLLFGSKDKTNWEHVLELVEKLDGSYPDFATHSLTEKARHEAGMHADMTDILKTLIQSKVVGPAVQLDNVKGSILEFRPNLDGTVQEGQMSVPYKNVKNTVIKDYTAATGDKKAEIADVNEWLSNNENYMYSYRSPIPYGGGAHMMRVISVHNDNDIAQLHPNDLFGRFEGDNDGDTLHIEQVPKKIAGIYLNVQEELTTIDMNKYAKKELVDISDRGALYDLIGEMTFGGKATGQIANIQNVYGQLQDTFYKALLDNEMVVLRGPKELSNLEGFEKETMETALRYYLQAALDNAEFLMLKKMNYDRNKLMKGLFKKSTGEGITDEQYAALRPVLNEMLEAPRLRNGQDREGPYPIEKTMHKSAAVHAFSHARTEYFMKLYEETLEDNRNAGTGEVEGVAKLEAIWFIEGQTIVEEVASRPFVVFNQMKKENPEYFQHIKENTFIEKTYNRHSALHQATMNVLIKAKPLQDVFFKEAEEAGLNIKEELRKGKEYEEAMGNAYFGTETTEGLIGKLKRLGPQVWDKSEEGIRFTEDWVDEFNALSNIARIEATFRFLERHAVASKLPPYGDKSKVMGLLHAGIMKNYNKIYNKYESIPKLDVTYGKEGKVKIQKYPGELAKAYGERVSAKHGSKIKGLLNFRKKNCP